MMFAHVRRFLGGFGGVSDATVLDALADGPRSSYGIQRVIERREQRYIGYGGLFNALERLQDRGVIYGWWDGAREGAPRRRIYAAIWRESAH